MSKRYRRTTIVDRNRRNDRMCRGDLTPNHGLSLWDVYSERLEPLQVQQLALQLRPGSPRRRLVLAIDRHHLPMDADGPGGGQQPADRPVRRRQVIEPLGRGLKQ